jgi:hypothetical protein
MFASLVQKDVTLKVEQPEVVAFLGTDEVTVTYRKLSGASLTKARQQATIVGAASLRALGGELIREVNKPEAGAALDEAAKKIAERKATVEGRKRSIYGEYDRPTVLLQGLVRWSCEDKMPLNEESRGALDEKHAQRLFELILEMSDPRLNPEALAAEGKGDSGPSTVS